MKKSNPIRWAIGLALLAIPLFGSLLLTSFTATGAQRLDYYVRDSDTCGSGLDYEWVSALPGTRWDLDQEPPLPEFVPVELPQAFVFYDHLYNHLWINDHGTILFGDDNLYNDSEPSGDPPIPNTTPLDPNGAIYLAWGNTYWHPADQPPETAVYTYHDTSDNRNWFIIEYHRYPNLLGDEDTMAVILDLESYDITMQYDTISNHDFTVVGIEDELGTDGILYVNAQEPAGNKLHDDLAIHYGLGEQPLILDIDLFPSTASGTGEAEGTVDYTLTLSSTSNITDNYTLDLNGNNWEVTLWDPTFTEPITEIGPLAPCASAQLGVRVHVPTLPEYKQDTVNVRASSKTNPQVTSFSQIKTDNAILGISAGPDVVTSGVPGKQVLHSLTISNTGNVTETYNMALSGGTWGMGFIPPVNRTQPVPPGASAQVTVTTLIPAGTPAGSWDEAQFTISSVKNQSVSDVATIRTEVLEHADVAWSVPYQEKVMPPGSTASYFITVRNTGNITDTFRVQPIGIDWFTKIYNDTFSKEITQTVLLGPNEFQRLAVRVLIPPMAQPWDQDSLLVRAVSSLVGTVHDYAMIVTRVQDEPAGAYDLDVQPAGSWQLAAAGEVVSYTLTLANSGTLTDSYLLSLAPAEWPGTTPANLGPLAPGTTTTVTVAIEVPADTQAGAWDEIRLLVTSVNDPAVTVVADLLSLLPGNPIYPPPPPTLNYYLPLLFKAPEGDSGEREQ